MGILYNRFTPEYVAPTTWTLLTSFTDVRTEVPLGDLTGKTELLVVCDNLVSILFPIYEMGNNALYDTAYPGKIYNTNTGTGYRFHVYFYHKTYNALKVEGYSESDISTSTQLSSVNTVVYAR